MRPNPHLLSQSDLLPILVEKIETAYPDDISLLICYGSFITGDHSSLSDIDFFFVPSTERGFDLNHQFIIGQIGYDLWAVSWGKLERIAGLEDQPASILMDGQVLYAASTGELDRLEA
ncbi:MAG: nucleotidyltransferase domain-containing protein, partial [Bacillota bacterium]